MSDINLSILVTSIRKVVDSVTASSESGHSKTTLVSQLIGSIIGSLMKLPANKPSNKKLYYTVEVLPVIHSVLDKLVENVVLDIDIVKESAFSIWCTRYYLVYPSIFSAPLLLSYLNTSGTNNELTMLLSKPEYSDLMSESINNFYTYLENLGANK